MGFVIAVVAFLAGYGLARRKALLGHFEAIWRKENRQVIEDIRAGRIGRPDGHSDSAKPPE